MAFEKTIEGGDAYGASITFTGNWSGTPVQVESTQPQTPTDAGAFKFDVSGTYTGNYGGRDRTLTMTPADDNFGYATYSGNIYKGYIGISLEKMGVISGRGEYVYNALGFKYTYDFVSDPIFGAKSSDTDLTIYCGDIRVKGYIVDDSQGQYSGTYSAINLQDISFANNVGALYERVTYVPGSYSITVDTDLPIFATDADLLEYCQSGGTITNKILNVENPEEEYENSTKYYYIKNQYSHFTGSSAYGISCNYAIQPKDGKIFLVEHTPTKNAPYTHYIYEKTSHSVYTAGAGVSPSDFPDGYSAGSMSQTTFLKKSLQFASDNKYSVKQFSTNMIIVKTESDADAYVNKTKTLEEIAVNYDELLRLEDDTAGPSYGDADDGTDQGYNGQSYMVAGCNLFVMTLTQLQTFFTEIFNTANLQDIINGTQLFNGDHINAINGIMYLPISDISKIAGLHTTLSYITVGSYQCQNAQGYQINKNNGLVDMGSLVITPVYNDFRDYEPYMEMFIELPYCGTIQLHIAKYINKTLSVKYAVDILTGSCTAYIYADGIILDSADGNMGSQRPITAINQQSYVSGMINKISNVGQSLNPVNAITKGLGGKGGASLGSFAGGAGMALGQGVDGVLAGFDTLQMTYSPPMNTRGGFAGNLGYFGVQKPHLIITQKRSKRPANELMTIGYPSNAGGKIGSFGGFLQCQAVSLANGFTGSEAERNELIGILKGGIYL